MRNTLDCIFRDFKLNFKSGQIFVKSVPTLDFIELQNLTGQRRKKVIAQQLTSIIYDNYYLSNGQSARNGESILALLIKANKSKRIIYEGFEVEFQFPDGSICCSKENQRFLVRPGNYLKDMDYKNVVGYKVSIIQFSEAYHDESFFYHIFGETLNDIGDLALLRFYFNVSSKGAIKLVELLTTLLNSKQVPFEMKCLLHKVNYKREDSLVLYVSYRFIEDITYIIQNAYDTVANELSTATPLFARRLASGIAFAENPPNPNESFGTSRCRLIAEGIIEANEKGVEDVKSYVLQHIENQGYNLDKFYLNPGSRFAYDFLAFETSM